MSSDGILMFDVGKTIEDILIFDEEGFRLNINSALKLRELLEKHLEKNGLKSLMVCLVSRGTTFYRMKLYYEALKIIIDGNPHLTLGRQFFKEGYFEEDEVVVPYRSNEFVKIEEIGNYVLALPQKYIVHFVDDNIEELGPYPYVYANAEYHFIWVDQSKTENNYVDTVAKALDDYYRHNIFVHDFIDYKKDMSHSEWLNNLKNQTYNEIPVSFLFAEEDVQEEAVRYNYLAEHYSNFYLKKGAGYSYSELFEVLNNTKNYYGIPIKMEKVEYYLYIYQISLTSFVDTLVEINMLEHIFDNAPLWNVKPRHNKQICRELFEHLNMSCAISRKNNVNKEKAKTLVLTSNIEEQIA